MITKISLCRAAEKNISVHEKDATPENTIYRLRQLMLTLEDIAEMAESEAHRIGLRISEIDDI